MTITTEEIEALGLTTEEITDNGGGAIICPECKRGLKFNSGNPAVYHEEDCPRYDEGPTYVGGPAYVKLPATRLPDGTFKVTT